MGKINIQKLNGPKYSAKIMQIWAFNTSFWWQIKGENIPHMHNICDFLKQITFKKLNINIYSSRNSEIMKNEASNAPFLHNLGFSTP